MTSQEQKKVAEAVFKKIKNTLADARKINKEKGCTNAYDNWSRVRQMVEVSIVDHDKWDSNGRRYTESYSIDVDDNEVAKGIKYRTDIQEIFNALMGLLKEQAKAKGWGGLVYTTDKTYFGGSSWNTYATTYVDKVCLADAVCPEYKSLINYIVKYGIVDRYKTKVSSLPNYRYFCSAMGGKRGTLWDEYGERVFLDNKPKKCKRYLDELRKNRGTKDIMLFSEGEENYIDPIDQQYSERHEIECDGEKRHYLKITIKTPSGKVKYETKIY